MAAEVQSITSVRPHRLRTSLADHCTDTGRSCSGEAVGQQKKSLFVSEVYLPAVASNYCRLHGNPTLRYCTRGSKRLLLLEECCNSSANLAGTSMMFSDFELRLRFEMANGSVDEKSRATYRAPLSIQFAYVAGYQLKQSILSQRGLVTPFPALN